MAKYIESEEYPDNEYPPEEQTFGNKYKERCRGNFQTNRCIEENIAYRKF